ncbi:hypothetical protein FHS10_000156 [Mucilaginibacter dorajii]|nr:hypothetical protein [Mucilaginibacter dorajii]
MTNAYQHIIAKTQPATSLLNVINIAVIIIVPILPGVS